MASQSRRVGGWRGPGAGLARARADNQVEAVEATDTHVGHGISVGASLADWAERASDVIGAAHFHWPTSFWHRLSPPGGRPSR